MNNNKEYICLIGETATAIKRIDHDIYNLIEQMRPIDVHIPAIINKNVLEKIGYFDSFPHQIIGIKPLKEQNKYDNMLLTPSACLHFYPIFGDRQIDSGVFTTRARVYRNEEKQTDGQTRLIDFTVREIVVVGTVDDVMSKLNNIGSLIVEYGNSIGLNIKLEAASDPFYPSRENTIKKKLQLINKQKMEMIINLNGEKLSIGSINYHGFHFSKAFQFDRNNTIVTGCIGVGLERWISSLTNNKVQELLERDNKNRV